MLVTMIWIPSLGAGAFGLSTTLTFAANAGILAYLLRKRLGLFGGRKILVSVLRSIIASAVMAACIYLMKWYMRDMANWVIVLTCVPGGAFIFFVVVWLTGAPEIGELRGIKSADSV
jgi:putative peptidoglycan lipid II flippase